MKFDKSYSCPERNESYLSISWGGRGKGKLHALVAVPVKPLVFSGDFDVLAFKCRSDTVIIGLLMFTWGLSGRSC